MPTFFPFHSFFFFSVRLFQNLVYRVICLSPWVAIRYSSVFPSFFGSEFGE